MAIQSDIRSSASVQFRRFHMRQILSQFDPSRGPLDLYISMLFRETPQLGSKDRAYISEAIYAYFRWKILIEYLYDRHERTSGSDCQEYWSFIFDLLDSQDRLLEVLVDSSIPYHVRLSLPEELFNALQESWNEEFEPLAISLNRPAPLTIRVNRAVTTPDELYNRLFEKGLPVIRDEDFPETLHFSKRVNLFSLPEFQDGFFEVQDKGSQVIAKMVEAKEKQHVLDYCAGSGGKSLAIAPDMKGSGQMYLHDVRIEALHQARKRFKRAKIQHVQWIHSDEKAKMSKLRGKMDWVLVDAPCSGTGTVRRNPDMKWKFSMEMVHRLQEEQKSILKEAVQFLSPRGRLVYATCSLLREENDAILEYAQQELGLIIDDANRDLKSPASFKTAPHTGVWDGFFAVRLKKSA
ncbi:MAG: RsmB/NOP family class I SAM-dependent RNA methyltransferase [Chlamydia sp.]